MCAATDKPAHTELIRASQHGLKICARPYEDLAKKLGVSESDVLTQLQSMQEHGLIRRIAAVPNHYALGYIANGMCVWDIADPILDEIGQWLGSLAGVSHCYRRPRHPPHWPYNLFAMLHGKNHQTVLEQAAGICEHIQSRFPDALQGHDILFSTAILKKTGLRLRSP